MTSSRSAGPGRWLIPLGLIASLSACGGKPDAAGNTADSGREQLTRDQAPTRASAGLPGTPMAQREAVLGLLNKRNGITRELKMKPGEALRVGNAIVRLRACETTAPWEMDRETGAFVQLDVLESRDDKWHRTFSGWVFKERPERNVVIHPVYDVWVMSCAMTWPEAGPDTVRVAEKAARSAGSASNASSAPKSPDNASAPSASASPNSPE